jgi:hypothetical protein
MLSYPPGPVAHFSLERLDFISVATVSSVPASTPRCRRRLAGDTTGTAPLSQSSPGPSTPTPRCTTQQTWNTPSLIHDPTLSDHSAGHRPSPPAAGGSVTEKEDDPDDYQVVPVASTSASASASSPAHATRSTLKCSAPN